VTVCGFIKTSQAKHTRLIRHFDMNLRPLKNNVLICLDPVPEKSASGLIWLREESREKPHFGTVIDAAPEAVKFLIRKYGEDCMGRRVVCPAHSGTVVEMNGEPHLIAPAEDILGIAT
jgi:co-chaperonin GroES (HSP10)